MKTAAVLLFVFAFDSDRFNLFPATGKAGAGLEKQLKGQNVTTLRGAFYIEIKGFFFSFNKPEQTKNNLLLATS